MGIVSCHTQFNKNPIVFFVFSVLLLFKCNVNEKHVFLSDIRYSLHLLA